MKIGSKSKSNTLRKKTEQLADPDLIRSERKYHALFDTMVQGVFYQAADGSLIDVNPAALEMLGLSRIEFMGRNSYNTGWKVVDKNGKFLRPEEHPSMIALNSGNTVNNIIIGVFNHRKGNYVWMDVSAIPEYREKESHPYQVMVTLHDITSKVNSEKELAESEKKFRSLYDNAPLAYQSLDINGFFNDVNPAWLNTLGYRREEVIGKYYADFLDPAGRELFEKKFPEFKRSGYVHDVQFSIKHKEGHYLDVSFEGCIGYNPDGSFRQTYCVFQDITKRKIAEEGLLEIQNRYTDLMDRARDAIFVISAEGILISVNRAFTNITGWQGEEWTGKNFISLIHPDDAPEVLKRFVAVMNGITTDPIELRILNKSGEYSIGEIMASPQIKNGVTVGILGIGRDITYRKRIESDLRKIEARNHLLMEHSGLGIGYYDLTGKILMFNKEALKNLGGPASDYIGKNVTEVFGKEAGEEYIERFRKTAESESALKFEDLVDYNGQPTWYLSTHTRILNDDGDIDGIQVIADNISEKKLFEDELRSSEEGFRLLVETIPDGVIVHSDGRVVFANPSSARIIGASNPAELIGKPVIDFVHPEFRAEALERIKNSLATNLRAPEQEEKFIRLDGNTIDVQVNASPISFNKKPAMLTVFNDISNRKKADADLRSSQEKLDLALRSAEMGVWYFDIKKKVMLFDIQTCNLLGIDHKTYKGSDVEFFNLLHAEDVKIVREGIKKTISKGIIYNPEFKIIRADGFINYLTMRGRRLSGPDGETIGIQGIIWDVTETVMAEEKIRENENIFEAFLENSPVYIFFKDKNLRALKLSRNYEKMLGLPLEDQLGKSMDELFPSDLAKSMEEDDRRIMEEKRTVNAFEELDGRFYETTKFPILKNGQPYMLAGFTIDVTLRHEWEKKLNQKIEELERFNNLMVEREIKMIELKAEVNELLSRLGEEQRYRIVK
jgi:PAS domain S-box-containing protein